MNLKPLLSLSLPALTLAAATPFSLAQQPPLAPDSNPMGVASLLTALAQQPPSAPDSAPPLKPGARRSVVRVITTDDMHNDSRIVPPGIWWKNPDLIQKLTLTPDQQKRMNDIFQQARLQLIDLKANVEKQEVLLEPMLDANPPDTNKVLAQIDHTAQARADLEKANARMLLGIRNVLSPDQWTRLQAEERNHRTIFRRDGLDMMRFSPGSRGPGEIHELHLNPGDGEMTAPHPPLPPME